MCLLFFKINNDAKGDAEYKLIQINVRDEFYTRPTLPADFWIDYPDIIGGMDIQEGRKGGTWLAFNKNTKKLGILLNILQPSDDIDMTKNGRGFIVTDFINDVNISPTDYCKLLKKDGDSYNGFLSVSLQVEKDKIFGSFYTNSSICYNDANNFIDATSDAKNMNRRQSGVSDVNVIESNQIYGFGNSINFLNPWPKVKYGRTKFESVLNDHFNCLSSTKDDLINDLFEMITDDKRLDIDDSMIKQGNGRRSGFIESLSTLNVHIPTVNYGSRTWTIILINGNGNVDFIERTLNEPENNSKIFDKTNWRQVHHKFNI